MLEWLDSRIYTPIFKANDKLSLLQKRWEHFEKKNIYLTSRDRKQFEDNLADIKDDRKWVKRFAFAYEKAARHLLKEQDNTLRKFEKKVDEYNENFISNKKQEHVSFFDGKEDQLEHPLDKEQRRAIVTNDYHNLLVAAAGSGKTNTLIARITYLIRHEGVSPHRILALAFNNAAAAEIEQRLRNTYAIRDVEIRTFHSFAFQITKLTTFHLV